MSKRDGSVAVVVLLAVSLAACGPTGDDDGKKNKKNNVDYTKLSEDSLVGTWRHVSFGPTEEASQTAVESDITWTFRGDGTGTYRQKNQFTDTESGYDWSLDGKDIKFGGSANYTVVSYSENEMVWDNLKTQVPGGQDYYLVQRE